MTHIAAGRDHIEALCGLGGSYHVVVDDGHSLVTLGGLAGLRQLFTAHIKQRAVFASSPQPLAAVAQYPGIHGGLLRRFSVRTCLNCTNAPRRIPW
jgi:hypothetical protein